MRRIGTTLESIYRAHQTRLVSKVEIQPGGEALAQMSEAQTVSRESLRTTQGGTVYPVFVVGLHNPDDTEVVRWIP